MKEGWQSSDAEKVGGRMWRVKCCMLRKATVARSSWKLGMQLSVGSSMEVTNKAAERYECLQAAVHALLVAHGSAADSIVEKQVHPLCTASCIVGNRCSENNKK